MVSFVNLFCVESVECSRYWESQDIVNLGCLIIYPLLPLPLWNGWDNCFVKNLDNNCLVTVDDTCLVFQTMTEDPSATNLNHWAYLQ